MRAQSSKDSQTCVICWGLQLLLVLALLIAVSMSSIPSYLIDGNLDELFADFLGILQGFWQWLQQAYLNNRTGIVGILNVVDQVGTSSAYTAGVGGVFVLFVLRARNKAPLILEIFTRLFDPTPFPHARNLGVSNRQFVTVRTILFLSALYLLYEVVHVPLTFGNQSAVSFYTDVVIRLALVILLTIAHATMDYTISSISHIQEETHLRLVSWYREHFEELEVTTKMVNRWALSILAMLVVPRIADLLPLVLDPLFVR